jgi:hypothetical protein
MSTPQAAPVVTTLTSILQILKLNEPRSGKTAAGRDWIMQDAECCILTDAGEVQQVGVLMIPKDLMGSVKPGVFMGSFSLRADTSKDGGRRIMPVLVGLQPYSVKQPAVVGSK